MGDHHAGYAKFASEIKHQLIDLGAGDWVKASAGLVIKQNPGIQRQCARQARALFHAAGYLRWKFIGVLAQSNQFQFNHHLNFNNVRVQCRVLAQWQRDVVGDAHAVEERARLKKNSKLFSHGVQARLANGGNLLAKNFDRALAGLQTANQMSQQRAFTATRTAHDHHGLAFGDIQIDSIQHGLRAEAPN